MLCLHLQHSSLLLDLISLCPAATTSRERREGTEQRPVQPVTCPSLTKRETGFDVGEERIGVGKKSLSWEEELTWGVPLMGFP